MEPKTRIKSSTMLKFNKKYFLLFSALLCIEIMIALFVKDTFIRPHIGDYLVVILIYCFTKSFLDWHYYTAGVATLIFAYAVEISQYFKLIEKLGLQKETIAKTIYGTHFDWIDILAYTLGIVTVLTVEAYKNSRVKRMKD